LKKMVQKMVL